MTILGSQFVIILQGMDSKRKMLILAHAVGVFLTQEPSNEHGIQCYIIQE